MSCRLYFITGCGCEYTRTARQVQAILFGIYRIGVVKNLSLPGRARTPLTNCFEINQIAGVLSWQVDH
jgi:hypothetical protein